MSAKTERRDLIRDVGNKWTRLSESVSTSLSSRLVSLVSETYSRGSNAGVRPERNTVTQNCSLLIEDPLNVPWHCLFLNKALDVFFFFF